jgi:phage portal protein BeeE
MATLRTLRRAATDGANEERLSLTDVVEWANISNGGGMFPYGWGQQLLNKNIEVNANSLAEYASQVYKRNGIVYACMAVRQAIFAEIRFRFANLDNGQIGRLYGTAALDLLAKPWPNGTTGELAARMLQDVDLCGNTYWVVNNNQLYRRDPDKVQIVLNDVNDDGEYMEILGYTYWPDGFLPGAKHFTYEAAQVCHWSPYPDPTAHYKGMSWLTPVLREIASDGAATDHKMDFFNNGAVPQLVVQTPAEIMTQDQFDQFKAKMDRDHTGKGKRYKTLYLAPGADVTVVGKDFQQLDFSNTQGRDETRIAAAAGVPAVIVGLKESMQGSSLNAGNYGQARRRFADGTMRPLFRSAAAALQTIVAPPSPNSVLWYDDSDVAFFREDRSDSAEIFYRKALTIESLVRAGYEPATVQDAVNNEDLAALQHTGLFSVQLQPAGSDHNGMNDTNGDSNGS